MSWAEITEYVLQLPYQQGVWVPKESVVHPQRAGIPYTYFAYRKTVPDGRAIDIKEDGDYWRIHWDWHNPDTHLIEHALDDAPLELLLTTTATGAAISPKGRRGEGALKGLGVGLGLLFLRAIARKN